MVVAFISAIHDNVGRGKKAMMSDTFYQVQGAYGRSYNNLINAKRDWEAGLDFCMMNGHTYVNKSDHEKFGRHQDVKIHLGNGLWGNLA